MIRNFSELPETIDGLKFFIMAGDKSIKELRNKANRLEQLVFEANERLNVKENSPKKETML